MRLRNPIAKAVTRIRPKIVPNKRKSLIEALKRREEIEPESSTPFRDLRKTLENGR